MHHFWIPSRSTRTARRAFALALMLSGAWGSMTAGCSSSVSPKTGEAKGCTLNSDCTAPLVCSFGLCHVACATSTDCARGENCISDNGAGVCQLAQEATCTRTSDCPETLTCAVDGQCRSQCVTARDCLRDQVCAAGGVCADTSEVNPGNTLKGSQGDAGSANVSAGGQTGAGGTTGGTNTGVGGIPNTSTGGFVGTGGFIGTGGMIVTTKDGGPGGFGGGVGGFGGGVGGFGGGVGGFGGTGGTTSGCSAGFHLCGTHCTSDTSVTECGTQCMTCTAPLNATPTCSQVGCSFECDAPYVKSGASCVPPPPRLVYPSSGTTVGTRLPTLKWQSPATSTGSYVEICNDRACNDVILGRSVAGSTFTVDTALPTGLVFWRILDGAVPDGGTPSGSSSATWELTVEGTHDAPKTTAFGVVPDFDGDGFADVILTTSSGLSVYPGSPTGLANSTLSWAPQGGGGPKSSLPVGDVDGDGYVDLVLAGFNGIELHGGSPSGLSSAAKQTVTFQGGGPVAGDGSAATADYDGDGYADYLYTSRYTDAQQNTYLVLNVLAGGAKGLSSTVVTQNTAVLNQPSPTGGLANCDVNGDGYMDVVFASFMGGIGGSLAVFYGSATGLDATTPVTKTLGQTVAGFLSCAGDVNGDGYDDAVILGNGLYTLYGSPVGLGNPGSALTSGQLPFGSAQLYGLGDANGDGYADVAAPSTTSPNVIVYLGGASGLTAGSTMTIVPPPPASFTVASSNLTALTAVGDVDRDGFADIGFGVDFRDAAQVHNQEAFVFRGGAPVHATPISTLPLAIQGML